MLNELGADVGEWANKEASRAIHDFVVKHLGVECARFNGDLDLPLQMITREAHRAALDHCFQMANRDPPSFTLTEDDAGEMVLDDKHKAI
jgi:hypothetical protein